MLQPTAGGRRPQASTIIAGFLILALAVVTVIGALTAFQLPAHISEEGRRTTILYEVVLAISFIVFFGVTAAIIWACFRFRRRGPEMPAQIHGSSVLEMTWTIVPILILIPFFIWSVVLIHKLKTPPAEADADVVIDVIGHQWWWEFDYTNDGFKVQATPPNYNDLQPPHLVVPEGKTVLLRVHSADVVHSFYAPHLLYKIQAVPGNVNRMHFKATEIGQFHGQCYQFCGLRHSDMLWVLDVRSQSDYNSYVQQQKSASTSGQ